MKGTRCNFDAEINAALERFRAEDPAIAGLLELVAADRANVAVVLEQLGYLSSPPDSPAPKDAPFLSAWENLTDAVGALVNYCVRSEISPPPQTLENRDYE
ncbi:hypothetical protein [Breoghania corrubedonensis]|uniref:hypothetical protein n=1 Tax=Breoghania corrubedonensis TaxID=665038 RepID=UPI0011B24C77|nr:hypothetical protein [Breoghania corrubedonensis]